MNRKGEQKRNAGAQRSPRVPHSWIERQISYDDPDLAESAIETLAAERDRMLDERGAGLGSEIEIWFEAITMRDIAARAKLDEAEFLGQVVADFQTGVSVELREDWVDRDGQPKLRVAGAAWETVLWRGLRGEPPVEISCVESAQRLKHPNWLARFRPAVVRLNRITGERPLRRGFPKSLHDEYLKCLAAEQAAEEAIQRLTERRDLRAMLFEQIRSEISQREVDAEAALRARLRRQLEDQMEPVRQILHLLRMRSEDEQLEFSATVTDRHDDAEQTVGVSPSFARAQGRGESLWIEAPSSVGALLSQGARVRLRTSGAGWSDPVEVARSRVARDRCIIEMRMASESFSVGQSVEGICEPRFRWWAHQEAVNRLYKGETKGYWPALVKAISLPGELAPIPDGAELKGFFCDADPTAPALNGRQRQAVLGALSTNDIFCIQGPPGTGKTAVICEIVQQLASRGERVLLASTTHEAVNEVLNRIGNKDGIRALRVTVNDQKARGVEEHLPARVVEPFLSAARHRGELSSRFERKLNELETAHQLLDGLADAKRKADEANAKLRRAGSARQKAESDLQSRGAKLRKSARADEREALALRGVIENEESERDLLEARLATESGRSGGLRRIATWFGLGKVARLAREVSLRTKRIGSGREQIARLLLQAEQTSTELQSLESHAALAVANARSAHELKIAADSRLNDCRGRCKADGVLYSLLDGADPSQLHALLEDRMSRLKVSQELARRFEKLLDDDLASASGFGQLGDELLALSNLICCTTSGIAGSPEIRKVEVDTLIVDEASRLTDSEFLIGAVRAKRWVLVGDEQQLPPFVHQGDEHFVHGLLSLQQAEKSEVSLQDAVESLADWWHEDEEHHKFRVDSVFKIASGLLASGLWESRYRKELKDRLAKLGAANQDPVKLTLRAMQQSFVHSLFERLVEECPPSKRVRLVEQRRMIAPIAKIVCEPIYSGEYVTPPEERSGVSPLSTSTFPRPVTFLSTSLYAQRAEDETVENGFVNRLEAEWVVAACKAIDRDLVAANADRVSASILAFYQAQASLVLEKLQSEKFSRLVIANCSPIDGMQGKESDFVILSFCRATSRKVIGPKYGTWLQDVRRLNVACTRARRGLILVGHKEMLEKLNGEERAIRFYENLSRLFLEESDSMQVIEDFRES